MVEKVSYTMEVPKETKELFDAVGGIIEHFKAGKSVTEAMVLLPAVMEAVDGINKVGEEAKSEYLDEGAAYGVHKIIGALRSGGQSA